MNANIERPWRKDELGPSKVAFLRLAGDVEAVVVVDNTMLGRAIGGVRLAARVDVAVVARLARAMTFKNAAAGLPHGGGKAGISVGSSLEPAGLESVIRAFAAAIRDLVEYVPGPDMGTDETAMAWIHDEIGRSVGLPRVLGGVPLDELGATGFGLAICAEELERTGALTLDGARVAVQGFGSVGRHAAMQLAQRGARIVAVSDSLGAVYDPSGLDVAALVEFKRHGHIGDFPDGKPLERDALLGVDCDVLVPAAQPDVVTTRNVGRVAAHVVLQGANIPVTREAELALHQRGVLCVPDIIANAGGVICAAVELRGGDEHQAFGAIEAKIRANTIELMTLIARGAEPREAADRMALARIEEAATYHRAF